MRRVLSALMALMVAGSTAAAQAHPDFSGKWSLDPATVNAAIPAGTSILMVVKQDEKVLNVDLTLTSPMGDQKRATAVNLDGSPNKNTLATPMGSIDLVATLAWEGPVAVVTSKGDVQGQSMVLTEKWTLGGEGKTLRLETTIEAGGMNNSSSLAFIKQ